MKSERIQIKKLLSLVTLLTFLTVGVFAQVPDNKKSSSHQGLKMVESTPPNNDTEFIFEKPQLPFIKVDFEDEHGQKIVGGDDAEISDYPWQVMFMVKSGSQYYFACGGSIINEEWVLTAAHCTEDYSAASIYINAGVSTFVQGQLIQVAEKIEHPDYNMPENDVALLKLDSPLDLSGENAKAIPIITQDHADIGYTDHGIMAMISGWGALAYQGNSPEVLQAAELPITEDPYGLPSSYITDDMIMAGYEEGGVDACQGDSGGPLVVPDPDSPLGYSLTGVVSWGIGCADPRSPGVYARVSYFQDWIQDETGLSWDGPTGSGVANPANLSAEAVSTSEIEVSWTKNDADNDVMLIWSADGFFGTPEEGTLYSQGEDITGGGEVLYRGPDTSFNHIDLDSDTRYYYRAFSYNDDNIYSFGRNAFTSTLSDWMHWDTRINSNAIGLANGGKFYIASRWEPDDIASYDGMAITKIRMYINDLATDATIKVWQGPDHSDLTEYVSQPFTQQENSWVEVELYAPHFIDVSEELWFGVEYIHAADKYPAGIDGSTEHSGKGNMIRIADQTWAALSDLNSDLTGNWNLQAYPDTPPPAPEVIWPSASDITYGQALSESSLTGGSASYDGTTVPGVFAFANPDHTPNAGVYSAEVLFNPIDSEAYSAVAGNIDVTVNIATATVTLSDLMQVYTGSPLTVAVTTSPSGLPVDVTYDGDTDEPVDAGSYDVVATVNHNNYQGTASGAFTIIKATATVTLSDLKQKYTGDPLSITVTTTPEGLNVVVTYDGSDELPVEEGEYDVVATVVEDNYEGEAEGVFTIFIDDDTNFIADFGKHNISIFPNPSRGLLNISSDVWVSNVEIFDITGKLIYSSQEEGYKLVLTLSDINSGMYFIRLQTINGPVTNKLQISK